MQKGKPTPTAMLAPSLTARGYECEATAVAKGETLMVAGVVDVADGGR